MKKTLLIVLLFLLGLGGYFLLQNEKHNIADNKIGKEIEKPVADKGVSTKETPKIKEIRKTVSATKIVKNEAEKIAVKPSFKLNRIHTWSMLKIKPLATPEGVYYTFSGFDVINNSTACIVGKFNNIDLLKITKDNKVIDVQLPAAPMDVKALNNNIYVLTAKGLSVVNNSKIIENITLNDPKLPFYDKLMVFDKHLFILMSDGSAYQLVKNSLVNRKALLTTTNQEIWIQKMGRNGFELKATPCQDICQKAQYPNEIGSITLSGGNSNNIFVCVDKYSNTKPIRIKRVITSSHSQFKKELLTLPADTYTYIKNDYKIVNNIIYYVKVNEKGFRIVQKQL